MQTRTFTQQRIVEATERGYLITDEGEVLGPKGQLATKLYGNQRYPTISTNWGGRVFGIPTHALAAYCFYGEESFKKGIVVRHVDGNTLNVSKKNLILGSHSDNNLDKSSTVRIAAAKKARAAQGKPAKNRKLTEEQVQKVREFYSNLVSIKAPAGTIAALAKELGVSRTVLCKIKNGEYYAC